MTFVISYANVLTIVYILVGLCLIVALIYTIKILYNVSKISTKVRETVEIINKLVIKPINISREIFGKIEKLLKGKKEEK